MDLAILVYLISILKPIVVTCAALMFLSIVIVCIATIEARVHRNMDSKSYIPLRRWCIAGIVISGIGLMFIPSERTAYMMVGAYTAQKIATDPTVAKLNTKIIELVERKIDEYGSELLTPTAK